MRAVVFLSCRTSFLMSFNYLSGVGSLWWSRKLIPTLSKAPQVTPMMIITGYLWIKIEQEFDYGNVHR